mmetsp:Transcript_69630/g.185405  ORF Transcript_69630/g.185405 Transcript_69630/m.185405 type:complete len:389 (+) Transcript_69630:343-1509(+)
MLSYDLSALVKYGGYFSILSAGTVFSTSSHTLKEVGSFALLGLGVAALVSQSNLKDSHVDDVLSIAVYLNRAVPFVLALYLSLGLARWWTLRTKALGVLLASSANVVMQLVSFAPQRKYWKTHEKVYRLAMASVLLVVKAARTTDTHIRADGLVAMNYLMEPEAAALNSVPRFQAPMVCWCWILRLCAEVVVDEMHRGDSGASCMLPLVSLQRHCSIARDGVQSIHTHLSTQLPFAYVHLIIWLVNSSNFALAFLGGVSGCLAWQRRDFQAIAIQIVFQVVVPAVYQGLLVVTYIIHDPMGEDILDFPIIAYQTSTSQQCEYFESVGCQRFPAAHIISKIERGKKVAPDLCEKGASAENTTETQTICRSLSTEIELGCRIAKSNLDSL